MGRVLMISPYFVPMSAVGAKRTLHFARHLPAHGWQPAVVALPADLAPDPALAPLVPPVPLLRNLRGGPTAWLEDRAAPTGRATLPGWTAPRAPQDRAPLARAGAALAGLAGPLDRLAKHLPWALPGVLRFARDQRCEVIYATAGPMSSLLLAGAVARRTGLPLVLDLRDPWALEPSYRASWTPGGRRVADTLEAALFARAARVILNTAAAREAYVRHYARRLPAARFGCIRNHFDPGLYGPPGPPPAPGDPFRIMYFGHLRPSKNAALFLEALARFMALEGLGPGAVRLVMLGEITPADRAAFAALGLAEVVVHQPWLPFTRAPELLGQADVLLDLMGPGHHLQISGKLFDYLAVGRPILSVSPNPELDEIFARTGCGVRVALAVDAIVQALRDRYARRFEPFVPDPKGRLAYTAAPAAEALAAVLREAAGGDRGGR